jgi:hypothetical protein
MSRVRRAAAATQATTSVALLPTRRSSGVLRLKKNSSTDASGGGVGGEGDQWELELTELLQGLEQMALVKVRMQVPPPHRQTTGLYPLDTFVVAESTSPGAGMGLFSKAPLPTGRYILAFTGTVHEQGAAEGFQQTGWHCWLGTQEARAAAHREKERYGMTLVWPSVEPGEALGRMNRRQLWTVWRQHVSQQEYEAAMQKHHRVPEQRLRGLVEGLLKLIHQQAFWVDPIRLEPGTSGNDPWTVAHVELGARLNTREEGDPEGHTQLCESVSRGGPWTGLPVKAPADRACRAKAWLCLAQWGALMGWRGIWLRIPTNLHRAVEGYRFECSGGPPDPSDAQIGGPWPTAAVHGTFAEPALVSGWDGVLQDDCLRILWLRVPLPLIQTVEPPIAQPTGLGGLRELVLEYGRGAD